LKLFLLTELGLFTSLVHFSKAHGLQDPSTRVRFSSSCAYVALV